MSDITGKNKLSSATLNFSWFFVDSICPGVKFFYVNELSCSQHKGVLALNLFKHKTLKMGDIMTSLVEMISTWFSGVIASHILFMFGKSLSKAAGT